MRKPMTTLALLSAVAASLLGSGAAAAAVQVGSSATAADVRERQALLCNGREIERCAWINWDVTNSRIRGYASAYWGGYKTWYVEVRNVRLYEFPPYQYEKRRLVSESADIDGWQYPRDDAYTGLAPCRGLWYAVEYDWYGKDLNNNPASGHEGSAYHYC